MTSLLHILCLSTVAGCVIKKGPLLDRFIREARQNHLSIPKEMYKKKKINNISSYFVTNAVNEGGEGGL